MKIRLSTSSRANAGRGCRLKPEWAKDGDSCTGIKNSKKNSPARIRALAALEGGFKNCCLHSGQFDDGANMLLPRRFENAVTRCSNRLKCCTGKPSNSSFSISWMEGRSSVHSCFNESIRSSFAPPRARPLEVKRCKATLAAYGASRSKNGQQFVRIPSARDKRLLNAESESTVAQCPQRQRRIGSENFLRSGNCASTTPKVQL
jgi:hypothetical protein